MTRGLALAGRYLRTVRYLRPIQLYGRILFRLARPRPQTASAPPLRAGAGAWITPARRGASMTGPRQFSFLNVVGDLDTLGWNSTVPEKLWLYNQHYFDDLNARDAADRADWHRSLISDWIVCNLPGKGDGWEPYPTSLRIVNWLKWALAGNDLPPGAADSLAVQARWLTRRLEWHLLGNHLFVNAKALVFAGLFFDGPEARTWLTKGLSILRREVPEQILSDGGQFELSPMYHALALEDVLDLINLTRRFGGGLPEDQATQARTWADLVQPMQTWLNALCHPDREIAFFNDAAIGVAPSPAELATYATGLGFPFPPALAPLTVLKPGGYARIEHGRTVLIADVAPVGPDYLPGHAHADTLSFELSLDGRRLIVNSGTSVYGVDAERHRQRGTAAHSTVVLDGEDSSEVWGGFRVGRRARVLDVEARQSPSTLELQAAHDGYRHLAGRPIHRRRWSVSDSGLTVLDEITGEGRHEASILFHFGQDVELAEEAGGGFRIFDANTKQALAIVSIEPRTEAAIIPTTWHPRFGQSLPGVCLQIRLSGAAPFRHTTIFRWSAV